MSPKEQEAIYRTAIEQAKAEQALRREQRLAVSQKTAAKVPPYSVRKALREATLAVGREKP